MNSKIPQIICPNKSLPEWRQLVDGLGDERLAYLSFFRNNNQIPTVEQAWAILGSKKPGATAKPPGVPEPKPATAIIPGRPFSKSQKPKAPVPIAAIQFRRAVVTKISAEHFTTHFGRTRQGSKVLTEA